MTAVSARDEDSFAQLVAPHRRELAVHCYRMLGGVADAEDAVQETLLAAWRGLAGFEGRSSLRAWLYRIATNVCIRAAERKPPRMLSIDRGPACAPGDDLGAPVADDGWLEPWPHAVEAVTDPEALYARREAVELAFVAALQHLPPNQRAVLILRDVLAYSAEETAQLLDTSVGSVTSALQRARAALRARTPDRSQQREQLDAAQRRTVDAFVDAFERADVPALVELLTADARFTMPPLAAWFDGRDDFAAFFAERVFQMAWRAIAYTDVNAQPAIVGYQQQPDGSFRRGSLIVLGFRGGLVSTVTSFLDPVMLTHFGIPEEWPGGETSGLTD